jgi:hypothetical protein
MTKVFSMSSLQVSDCYVPVPGSNWVQCASTFHTIAAFYWSRSPRSFRRRSSRPMPSTRGCASASARPPARRCRARAARVRLQLLGFMVMTNLAEDNSIDAAQSLTNSP